MINDFDKTMKQLVADAPSIADAAWGEMSLADLLAEVDRAEANLAASEARLAKTLAAMESGTLCHEDDFEDEVEVLLENGGSILVPRDRIVTSDPEIEVLSNLGLEIAKECEEKAAYFRSKKL